MKNVLVVSSSIDQHVDFMMKRFKKRHVPVVRFNSDELASQTTVIYTPQIGHVVLRNNRHLFHPNEIKSVWFRKPMMTRHDWVTKKSAVAFAGRETEAYLFDVVASLTEENCRWINHPEANRLADNKLRQLRLAERLGLRVPQTIVSNSPLAVKKFVRQQISGKIIYKTLSNPFISETKKTFQSVYTTSIELSPEVLRAIRPVPCLIQEYINKDYELRVTVVGKQIFATRIFSQEHLETKIDWRRDQHKIQLRQELTILDDTVAKACVKIVDQLNLTFGAIDLIVTPEGEYVFLEINPNGQWAWIEIILGAPISDALIDELTVL